MGLDFGSKGRLMQSLLDHEDCELKVHWYGDRDMPVDVTIECLSCGEVLLSCEDFEDSAIWEGAAEGSEEDKD